MGPHYGTSEGPGRAPLREPATSPLWGHYEPTMGPPMAPLWPHYGPTMTPLWAHYGPTMETSDFTAEVCQKKRPTMAPLWEPF